ncbi:OmpA family protein [Maribacter halichondriae]|uniref:OmpA family protein n=1 Tax=Maribacter halichondriae TaxID=2980554 RepID=UPI002358556C|nr:OmpA family protein [Maribacter sp. Hal144]
MKKIARLLRISLPLIFIFAFVPQANSQLLKKLGKRAEKAAERAVERRVEKETTEKTEEVLDSILEPGSKGEKEKKSPVPNGEPSTDSESGSHSPTIEGSSDPNTSSEPSGPKSITVYSKFDFVPGDKLLFFDDFANDFVGDFPSKWNTNGSGEVVTLNDSKDKWFEILPGYTTFYIPYVDLPEEYTLEFDILSSGIDAKTSSSAWLEVGISSDDKFRWGDYYVHANLPFAQYTPVGIRVKNHIKYGGGGINNVVKADIREAVLAQPHISIAVNKQRFRLWVNEKKYVDIPKAVPAEGAISTIKFQLHGFKDGKERLFIRNVKVAEGGLDLRRTLISDGKVSTNGILFDSGSANIQAQSMGIIRQIHQVLQQENNMKLKIVGHTDSDGEDASNMTLSKNRAEAVKNALVSVYGVSSDRLSTEGKGESEPVGDNGTTDGKAQNRRVEFIKQ